MWSCECIHQFSQMCLQIARDLIIIFPVIHFSHFTRIRPINSRVAMTYKYITQKTSQQHNILHNWTLRKKDVYLLYSYFNLSKIIKKKMLILQIYSINVFSCCYYVETKCITCIREETLNFQGVLDQMRVLFFCAT